MSDAREPSNAVIERIERFCMDYAQCLMDSTILVKRNYESMDRRALEKAEVVEDRLIRELAEYIATVGNVGSANTEEVLRQLVAQLGDAAGFHFASKYVDCIVEEYAGKFATAGMNEEEADSRDLMEAIRDDDGVRYSMDEVLDIMRKDVAATVGRSCASCPEMDNPDSYIRYLQSALKWHDEHVPRPTNPRNTCVVLEGEKVPEEVLFIGTNGVTHYLPEVTCKQEDWSTEGDHAMVWLTCGHDCMVETVADLPKFCQECGAKVVTE